MASEWSFSDEQAPPDPRHGIRDATLFALEVVLAMGLIMRQVAHQVATVVVTGEPVAEERLRYGLGVGFRVRDRALSTRHQFEIASVSAGFLGGWWLALLTQVEWGGGLALVLIANAAVVIGDPLWIGIDHIRRTS